MLAGVNIIPTRQVSAMLGRTGSGSVEPTEEHVTQDVSLMAVPLCRGLRRQQTEMVACVTLGDGISSTEKEIIDFCRSRRAHFTCPQRRCPTSVVVELHIRGAIAGCNFDSTSFDSCGYNFCNCGRVIDLAPYNGITAQPSMADVGVAGRSRLAAALSVHAEFRETVSLAFACSFGLPPGVAVPGGLCFG
jgi:hypothetical protein